MPDRKAINEYLFYEFGYDLQQPPSVVNDNWPFELKRVGTIYSAKGEIEVFEFVAGGEVYFALSGNTLTFYPAAGMSLRDLQLQYDGSAWIARQHPTNLATSQLGDESVPSVTERQAAIEALAARVCRSFRILEGLYLCATGVYLALIEDTHTGTVTIVGSGLEPTTVAFPQASSWRRLAYGIGRMLQKGVLR